MQDLHPGFDFRYSYKVEDITYDALNMEIDKLKLEIPKLEEMRISLRRNFRSMAFSPLMTKESKMQVERRVSELLGELYGQYRTVTRLENTDIDWLNSVGISLSRSPLHDASGINDDFPVGRGVFIDDNREFVVLVNFEDHVQIIMLPGQELKGQTDYKSIFKRLEKVN